MIRRASRRTIGVVGEYGWALSRHISLALLAVLALLWLSGLYWLLLHYVWARPGDFGVIRHPLEAPTLLVHGIVAMFALFLLGWFAGRHAGAVSSGRRVRSGWPLTIMTGVLLLAGCAQLFLTSAAWQSAIAVVHEAIGVALPLPLLVHGWRASAAARERDRDRAPPHAQHAGRHGARRPTHSARN
jgi:hypothetical protein